MRDNQSLNAGSKDQFFDMIDDKMKEFRNDETLTHLVVIGVHLNADDPDESDGMKSAPVTFFHNMGDNYEAAVFVNNTSAMIAMQAKEHEDAQTRQ